MNDLEIARNRNRFLLDGIKEEPEPKKLRNLNRDQHFTGLAFAGACLISFAIGKIAPGAPSYAMACVVAFAAYGIGVLGMYNWLGLEEPQSLWKLPKKN